MMMMRFLVRSLTLFLCLTLTLPAFAQDGRTPLRAKNGIVASASDIASQVGVDILVGAGDEAGDEDALARRHIQLRLDRRFKRGLVNGRAARGDRQDREVFEALVASVNGISQGIQGSG